MPGNDSDATPSRSSHRSFSFWLLGIALLAIALRILSAGAILRSPLGATLVGDASYYHAEAQRIVGMLPDDNPTGIRFMNVGYPYLLAALYVFVGPSVVAVLCAQAAIGALTAVVLSLAARQILGSSRAAVLSGLLYAVYTGAVFYDGLLLTPSLTNACVAVSLFAIARGLPDLRFRHAITAGVALGYAALIRPNLALLAVAFALYLGFVRQDGPGAPSRLRGWVMGAALLLAAASLPLPTILYHGLAHGRWAPASANAGMNFWIGNHRGASGVYSAAEFSGTHSAAGEEHAFLEEARRRVGDPELTLTASDRFWLREGWTEIRAAPLGWVRLAGSKLAYFWSRHEIRTNVGLDFMRRFSPVLSYLSVGFAAIAILGIAGLVHLAVKGRARAAGLLACVVAAPLVTCVLFFVSGEYRHPASLALVISSAWMIEAVLTSFALRSPPRLESFSAPIAAALLSLPLVLWPFAQSAAAAAPQLDAFNFTAAILTPARDGSGPSREEFRRASAVLDHFRDDRAAHVVLVDAHLWLHYRAAVEFQDADEARSALRAARELGRLAGFAREGSHRRYLESSLVARIADLSGREFVRADPALAREVGEVRETLERLEPVGPFRPPVPDHEMEN